MMNRPFPTKEKERIDESHGHFIKDSTIIHEDINPNNNSFNPKPGYGEGQDGEKNHG